MDLSSLNNIFFGGGVGYQAMTHDYLIHTHLAHWAVKFISALQWPCYTIPVTPYKNNWKANIQIQVFWDVILSPWDSSFWYIAFNFRVKQPKNFEQPDPEDKETMILWTVVNYLPDTNVTSQKTWTFSNAAARTNSKCSKYALSTHKSNTEY